MKKKDGLLGKVKDTLPDPVIKATNDFEKILQKNQEESEAQDEQDEKECNRLNIAWFLSIYLAKIHELAAEKDTSLYISKKSFQELASDYRDKFKVCFAYATPPISAEEEKARLDALEGDESDFAHVLNNVDEIKVSNICDKYTEELINSTQQLEDNKEILTDFIKDLLCCLNTETALSSSYELSKEELKYVLDEIQNEINEFTLDNDDVIKHIFKVFFETFAELHATLDLMPSKARNTKLYH